MNLYFVCLEIYCSRILCLLIDSLCQPDLFRNLIVIIVQIFTGHKQDLNYIYDSVLIQYLNKLITFKILDILN